MSLEKAITNPDRAFFTETITIGNCTVKIIAIEHENRYLQNIRQTIIPADWEQQVQKSLENADCLFIEYFPADINSIFEKIPIIGKIIKRYMKDDIDSLYGKIIDYAAQKNIPIATADPANKELYLPYEVVTGWPQMVHSFIKNLPQLQKAEITLDEALESLTYHPGKSKMSALPHATEARRIFTALGIQKYIESHPDIRELTLITAPAHARRISDVLRNGLNKNQKLNTFIFRTIFLGVGKSIRIYRYKNEAEKWELNEKKTLFGKKRT